jgi:hypothetical protein
VLTTSFIPATQTAVDLAAVSHVTATGPIKTDMAALVESSGGKGSVRILDASTGALLSTVSMIPLDAPRALAVSADINGNGADELVGLGERNGVDRIAIFDSQTGLKIMVISVP